MSTSRREFLGNATKSMLIYTSLPAGLALAGNEYQSDLYTGKVPICQNMTNEISAQFTILTEGKNPYAYRVKDSQGRDLPVRKWDEEHRKHSGYGIDKLIAEKLQADQLYRLQVIDKDRGTVLDERIFKSLPLNRKTNLRFAMISCSCDIYHSQNSNMWDRMFAELPELVFVLGDSVYCDLGSDGTEKDLWRRHCETRMTLAHFRQPRLIPTLATWDDHDYGRNNENRHYAMKHVSRRIFECFFGSTPVAGYRKGHGVGSVLTGFGQRFFLMDDRFFRDEPRTGGMMWGSDQQEWLLQTLGENEKPAWLMNGSQYFSSYIGNDSFQKEYMRNLSDLTGKLRRLEAPVVFASGDVHFSEVLKIEPQLLGYRTFEFTSSAMHSINYPTAWYMRNPRRLTHTWKHNFMIMKTETIKNGISTDLYCLGRTGKMLISHAGTVQR
ncbi:alkaline phosphatase D family protein [Bdellovibrio bacteriovorus]|uniref:alkaline phosphatase D family protein n=1 Tax=Bdellovibrio bacteriovorus TaxID=959 RepID=UPI003AA7D422